MLQLAPKDLLQPGLDGHAERLQSKILLLGLTKTTHVLPPTTPTQDLDARAGLPGTSASAGLPTRFL